VGEHLGQALAQGGEGVLGLLGCLVDGDVAELLHVFADVAPVLGLGEVVGVRPLLGEAVESTR
jgi:hypothetical protein